MAYVLTSSEYAIYALILVAAQLFIGVHRALITQPMNVLGAREVTHGLVNRYRAIVRLHIYLPPLLFFSLGAVALMYEIGVNAVLGVAAWLTLMLLQDTVRRYHYTLGSLSQVILIDFVCYVGQLGAVATVWWSLGAPSAGALLWFMAAGPLAACLLFSATAFHGKDCDSAGTTWEIIHEHWNFSRWMIASHVVFWAATQAYPFILAKLDFQALADFAIANAILNGLNVIRLMFANTLPTEAARVMGRGGVEGLQLLFRKSIIRAIIFSVMSVLFIVGVAPLAIEYFFADKYPLASSLLPWLAIGHLASVVGSITNALALVLGSTKVVFVSNLIAAGFSLLVGPVLILSFGVFGAVAGSVFAALMPNAVQLVNVLRLLYCSSARNNNV